MGKKLTRQMVGSLVGCVHCGMCTDSCHYVLANPDDPTYAPAYKADQIRKIFKRNFDWTGKIFPWWVHAEDIRTDEDLEKLKDIVFGKCTNCRRCSLNCPMGVDFATLNRMARGLLVSVGVMPEGVAIVSKDQWEVGNQMGVLPQDYVETLEWLSDELETEFKDPAARIPIDKMDADIVYAINPREVKYDPRTISDAARIFYLAGENWTMPSEGWDMTNFGLFSGDDELGGAVAQRVYDKVIELRGKTLVLSECGHGYRSTRCEGPNWSGNGVPFVIESSVLTMLRYIREGRIQVDKARNTEVVTFHDSCNNARSCGFTEEPRELLNLLVPDFREMYPNRAENFCCTGGGGAMSMSEYTPQRLKSAMIKADQLKATGAKTVVTSCHNCVDGLSDVIRHYKLGMKVTQLVNLAANALVVPEKVVVPVELAIPAVSSAADRIQDPGRGRRAGYSDLPRRGSGGSGSNGDSGGRRRAGAGVDHPGKTGSGDPRPVHAGEKRRIRIRGDPEQSGDRIHKGLHHHRKPELRRLIYERPVAPPEGYLDKPVDEETLLTNVRMILELKHTHGHA